MTSASILAVETLGFPWQTLDPFLFCVHHVDHYHAGNEKMGPAASLAGRQLGQDFAGIQGWNMYHGTTVPGFPKHPHRGFETITVVRSGFIDHSDSMGATSRFGAGDTQWMTAGRGVEHCEMFPLRDSAGPNTAELFQIWLNLPRRSKLVAPHFSMLWRETQPHMTFTDEAGRAVQVTVSVGSLAGLNAPAAPPDSWAANPDNGVAIATIKLAPQATWTLPATLAGLNRALYTFSSGQLRIAGDLITGKRRVRVHPEHALLLQNGDVESELLLLQGRPINEPVAQYGPFVMNSRAEIEQAFAEYQQGRFGRWPFTSSDPVHPREKGRFAIHGDGRVENPDSPQANDEP